MVALAEITFAESTWKRVITDVCSVPAVGLLVFSKLQAQLFANGLQGVEVLEFNLDDGYV